MKHSDLLSIIVPTYNEREDLLRKAIETILNQTYSRIELIVVDDGSTDQTPDVLRSYGKSIKAIRRERDSTFRSVPQAFSVGLEAATGGWWHHDAADCWHELDWAERCMAALDGREDAVMGAHGDFIVHHYDGRDEYYRVEQRWNPRLDYWHNYHYYEGLGGMIFRMDLCKKAGPWDWRLPRKHTHDWTLRVMRIALEQKLELVYVPRMVWHFLYHEPDQLKRFASIKYRILVDLKQGIDPLHNMQIALQHEDLRYAMIDACREFFTDDRWALERNILSPEGNRTTRDKLDRMRLVCNEEASEKWEPKHGVDSSVNGDSAAEKPADAEGHQHSRDGA